MYTYVTGPDRMIILVHILMDVKGCDIPTSDSIHVLPIKLK